MNHPVAYFLQKYHENFEFCTRMYTRSTGIEIVFNNQTVPILVLCVKTLCGIDLLSFNNLLHCILNHIDSLINGRENMSDVMCCDHFICSRMSHSDCVHF